MLYGIFIKLFINNLALTLAANIPTQGNTLHCLKSCQHKKNLLTVKSSHCYNVTHVNRETSQPLHVRTSINPAIRASGDNHMKTPFGNVVDAHSYNYGWKTNEQYLWYKI